MKRSTHLRKLPLVVGIGILSILTSGCSSLQMDDSATFYNNNPELDRVQRHAYAGIGVGSSWLNPDTSEVVGVSVNERVNSGGQITVGMDMSRQLSLELHSADLGSAGMSPSGRINYHLHGISALVHAGKQRHMFKRHGLKGYGRIGLGFLDNSPVGDIDYEKQNATHVLFGLGAEYMTRLGFGARAEIIYFDEDVRYGQLALVYRTGKRPEMRPVQIVEEPIPEPVEPVVVAALPEPIVAEAAPEVCGQFSGTLEGVTFKTNSDELTQEGLWVVQEAASRLSECNEGGISVSGHTDSVGAAKYNLDLSKRRAYTVASVLVQMGIQKDRLQARGFGETRPIDTNDTPEGRSQNRRVELVVQ